MGTYLNSERTEWVRFCTMDILNKIRPNVVALVDTNDFLDSLREIKTVFCYKDG